MSEIKNVREFFDDRKKYFVKNREFPVIEVIQQQVNIPIFILGILIISMLIIILIFTLLTYFTIKKKQKQPRMYQTQLK